MTPGGVKRFTIRGLLDPQGLARTLRGRLVVMDLYAAELAFTADGQINQIDVVLEPTADAEVTRAAIASVVPHALTVEEPAQRKDAIRRTIGGFQAMLTAFGLLTVVAGFVICYSRLGTIAAARTWEVGLLRAIGVRRTAVFAEILKESLLLGLAGAALGVPLGLVIARIGVPFLAATTALNFRSTIPAVAPSSGSRNRSARHSERARGRGRRNRLAGAPSRAHETVVALTLRGRDIPAATRYGTWSLRIAVPAAIVALISAQRATGISALGLVTTVLIVAAAALSLNPLARHGTIALEGVWRRVFGPAGRLAVDHVRERPGRSALAVATLALGLGTVLLFGILAWSFERTLVARLMASERSDMVISSAFITGGYRTAPLADALLPAAPRHLWRSHRGGRAEQGHRLS